MHPPTLVDVQWIFPRDSDKMPATEMEEQLGRSCKEQGSILLPKWCFSVFGVFHSNACFCDFPD
jgi:hypothetical protein